MTGWEAAILWFVVGLWVGTTICEYLHRAYKKVTDELVGAQREHIDLLEDLLSFSRTDGTP